MGAGGVAPGGALQKSTGMLRALGGTFYKANSGQHADQVEELAVALPSSKGVSRESSRSEMRLQAEEE